MNVYICFKKRASIPLAPCTVSAIAENTVSPGEFKYTTFSRCVFVQSSVVDPCYGDQSWAESATIQYVLTYSPRDLSIESSVVDW
jgi:hypothetical protein